MPPREFINDARSSFRVRDVHDGKKESVPRRSMVDDLQGRLQEALKKLIDAQSQVDSLTNENKELWTELQVEHSATEQLSVMRSQLESLKEENEKLRTERDADRKEMSVIRPQLESLKENYQNLRAESSRRLISSTDELNVSRSRSKALGLVNDELRAEKGSATQVRKLTDFLTCENENLFAELGSMESKLKEKETTIASLEEDLEFKLAKLHEVLVMHEVLVQSLKEPKSKVSWGSQIRRSMTKTETLGGDGDIKSTDLVVQTSCTTSHPRTSSSKHALSNKARRMNVMVGNLEATYTGSLEDSLPSGFGSFRFMNGDTDLGTYIGEVKYGNMHGRGTLYHASGFSRGAFERNVFVR
jgi:chromosome segregation ATPase